VGRGTRMEPERAGWEAAARAVPLGVSPRGGADPSTTRRQPELRAIPLPPTTGAPVDAFAGLPSLCSRTGPASDRHAHPDAASGGAGLPGPPRSSATRNQALEITWYGTGIRPVQPFLTDLQPDSPAHRVQEPLPVSTRTPAPIACSPSFATASLTKQGIPFAGDALHLVSHLLRRLVPHPASWLTGNRCQPPRSGERSSSWRAVLGPPGPRPEW
jgi:hypothetical protein